AIRDITTPSTMLSWPTMTLPTSSLSRRTSAWNPCTAPATGAAPASVIGSSLSRFDELEVALDVKAVAWGHSFLGHDLFGDRGVVGVHLPVRGAGEAALCRPEDGLGPRRPRPLLAVEPGQAALGVDGSGIAQQVG